MRIKIAVVGNDERLQTYIKKKYPMGIVYRIYNNYFFKQNGDILRNGKTNIFFITRPFDLLPSTRSHLNFVYIGKDMKSRTVYENYGGCIASYNIFCMYMNTLEWHECLCIDYRSLYFKRPKNISFINIGMIYCIHYVESNYRNVDANLYKLISSLKTD